MDSVFSSSVGNHLIDQGWVFCSRGDSKRRYWTNNVDGKAVKDRFYGEEVGYADTISGVIGGQHFHIHKMKDTYYTIMLMTTYVTLERCESEQVENEVQVSRDCLEPLHQTACCC